jgi:hypothetical protein
VRNAKTGNEGGKEGFSTGFGGSGGKRSCFKPSGGAVNDGENVCVALRWRKSANQVNVNVGETTGRNGNGLRRGRDVSVDFCLLARKTFTRPLIEVRGHVRPDKSGRD